MNDPGISWRLAFHEASHAVMDHVVFGDASIRSVRVYCLNGAVVLEQKFCHSIYDFSRLATVVAGSTGEALFAKKHVKASDRSLAQYADSDRKLIDQIITENGLSRRYLASQKRNITEGFKASFMKAAVADVASFLYENLFRLAYIKKSIRGTGIHQIIKDSFIRSAVACDSTEGKLREAALRIIFAPPCRQHVWE